MDFLSLYHLVLHAATFDTLLVVTCNTTFTTVAAADGDISKGWASGTAICQIV